MKKFEHFSQNREIQNEDFIFVQNSSRIVICCYNFLSNGTIFISNDKKFSSQFPKNQNHVLGAKVKFLLIASCNKGIHVAQRIWAICLMLETP